MLRPGLAFKIVAMRQKIKKYKKRMTKVKLAYKKYTTTPQSSFLSDSDSSMSEEEGEHVDMTMNKYKK